MNAQAQAQAQAEATNVAQAQAEAQAVLDTASQWTPKTVDLATQWLTSLGDITPTVTLLTANVLSLKNRKGDKRMVEEAGLADNFGRYIAHLRSKNDPLVPGKVFSHVRWALTKAPAKQGRYCVPVSIFEGLEHDTANTVTARIFTVKDAKELLAKDLTARVDAAKTPAERLVILKAEAASLKDAMSQLDTRVKAEEEAQAEAVRKAEEAAIRQQIAADILKAAQAQIDAKVAEALAKRAAPAPAPAKPNGK